jgi:hypothetical protein
MAKKIKKKKVHKIIRGHLLNFWACSLIIILATVGLGYGIAHADELKSRITAEPEWLEPNEKDDGKYAMMINKGILCDMKGIVFGRYHSKGYVSAFRGVNESGLDTYILLRSKFRDGRYLMNEMVILEIDEPNNVACVISENNRAEYNQDHIYLEIYPAGERI